ncbi:MAG: rhodanese [Blastopirellula sp.]|nr:MAG: rhodanese [Blastopirellula sp.]
MQRTIASIGFIFLITLLLTSPVAAQDLKEIKKKVDQKKAILIDVREKAEWDKSHYADARLIPYSKIMNAKEAQKIAKALPKDKEIYCHCMVGKRAERAANILKKYGVKIVPLKVKYADLRKAGFKEAPKK